MLKGQQHATDVECCKTSSDVQWEDARIQQMFFEVLGRVIPKTQKMVLDASLLNTQHYKVRIKGKVEQSRERSSALPYTLV